MGEQILVNVPIQVSFITNIIVNSVTCPFTVLLNALVIIAVKEDEDFRATPTSCWPV